jgi:CBS domain-containing protein
MGTKRRVALRVGTVAASALAARRASQLVKSREDVLGDLVERGERVGRTLQALLAEGRGRAADTARRRGPRVAMAVRTGGGRLAGAVGAAKGRVSEGVGEWWERRPLEEWRDRLPSVQLVRKEERSMFDRLFNRFTLGFGAGYVLGARAGRERYEQIVRWWEKVAGSPVVRQAAQQAAQQGKHLLGEAQERIQERVHQRGQWHQVRDVMTPLPATVKASETVAAAANTMRQLDVGSIIVVNDSGHAAGILTDRDIAVRAVAQGLDPQATTVGEIYSEELTSVSPNDSVDEAVRLMRDRAIRRLPVVEGDRPVGIVSIGDLAIERDRRSALADISAEVPNR